jgi:hypothetical protein
MGWGSILGGIGSIAAAPFTGGTSLAWLPAAIGAGGAVADALGQGRAAGRVQQAGVNSNQDQNKLRAAQLMEQALQGRAGIDLQQKQFALQAPGQRASNSVRGDVLAGVQDAGVQGPIIGTHGQIPQITGGLRPSLLSANTRQLGQNMSRDALLQNMNGADTFKPMPAIDVPQPTPLPEAGGFDKFLSGLGMVGGVLQGLDPEIRNMLKPKPQASSPMPDFTAGFG